MTAHLEQTSQLHTAQFALFMRAVAFMASLIGVFEMVISPFTAGRPLFLLGAGTFGVGMVALAAYVLTRRQRREAGVYTWVIGSSIIAGVGMPMAVHGVATAIMALGAMNTLMVALLLPPGQLGRLAPWLILTTAAATALERWTPWARLDLIAELFFIPLILNPLSFSFAVYLTHLLSDAMQGALAASRAYTQQVEQSRAALAQRTADLQELTTSLQQRTEELEKLSHNWQVTSQQAEQRARQLTAIAEMGRAIGQMRDVDQLLTQVSLLISKTFGHYHVGILLVDELRRFAVLRAASSEGGQRKLALGGPDLISQAIETGQACIAPDMPSGDPDLPETRSELVLPLRARDQIVGALDVHSAQPNAFTKEDVATLSILADQIANAIENARLFEQTQAALQEAQEAQRRYLQQQWEQLIAAPGGAAGEYRASSLQAPETAEARQPLAPPLSVPIVLGGQPIGMIDLHEVDPNRRWTEEDVTFVAAVADQAALALENARLFAQTQQRARREQLIAQISARMRAAPDVESILRTTVREVRRALGVSHGVIKLGIDAGTGEMRDER